MKALFRSFKFAINGIRLTVGQRNMRIHLCFAFYVILGGVFAEISKGEWIAVLICIGLVISAEAFNTALEAMCDDISRDYNERIKAAKDMAAGGVLVCAIISAAVGSIIFLNGEKTARAWSYAQAHPPLSVALLLLLPVWLYFIFRRKRND